MAVEDLGAWGPATGMLLDRMVPAQSYLGGKAHELAHWPWVLCIDYLPRLCIGVRAYQCDLGRP